jgi:hypothetical protein
MVPTSSVVVLSVHPMSDSARKGWVVLGLIFCLNMQVSQVATSECLSPMGIPFQRIRVRRIWMDWTERLRRSES